MLSFRIFYGRFDFSLTINESQGESVNHTMKYFNEDLDEEDFLEIRA